MEKLTRIFRLSKNKFHTYKKWQNMGAHAPPCKKNLCRLKHKSMTASLVINDK
jgi:hypothetical protein